MARERYCSLCGEALIGRQVVKCREGIQDRREFWRLRDSKALGTYHRDCFMRTAAAVLGIGGAENQRPMTVAKPLAPKAPALKLKTMCDGCRGEGGGAGWTCDMCSGTGKVQTTEGLLLSVFLEEHFEVVLPNGEVGELRRKR